MTSWRCSVVFVVNFVHISHLFLVLFVILVIFEDNEATIGAKTVHETNMWYFSQFGTIYAIWKTWKTQKQHASMGVFHIFKIVQMVPNCPKHYI